jgi:hypothetical protein
LLLDNIAVLSKPSFISGAYVQQLSEVEMWVVGVYGQIYSVEDDPDTASLLLKHARALNRDMSVSRTSWHTCKGAKP